MNGSLVGPPPDKNNRTKSCMFVAYFMKQNKHRYVLRHQTVRLKRQVRHKPATMYNAVSKKKKGSPKTFNAYIGQQPRGLIAKHTDVQQYRAGVSIPALLALSH